MNALYVKARNLALRLLTKNGAGLVMYRFSNTLNPVTALVTVTAVRQTLKTVVLPASAGLVEEFEDELKEDVVAGKVRYCLAAGKGASFNPKALDVMSYAGEYWSLIGCSPLDPDQSGAIIFKFAMNKANLSTEQIAAIAAIV